MENGDLALYTRYDAQLVSLLKERIPAGGRRFDPGRKAWLVEPHYASVLKGVVRETLGEDLVLPASLGVQAAAEGLKLLEVRYLGRCKTREDGQSVASGYSAGGWNALFPETVLQAWFLAESSHSELRSFYQVLNLSKAASEDELKSAYRRLARQWHPDVCKEPDAAEQFMQIQKAYDVLRNPDQRARYDAGLALEASYNTRKPEQPWIQSSFGQDGYRSPLRCGYILAEGRSSLGRFLASKIIQWEDIVNPQGLTLVVSWPQGADKWIENWV